MFCPKIIKLMRECIRGFISDKRGRTSIVLIMVIDLGFNCKISFKIHHCCILWENWELSSSLISLFSTHLCARWQILHECCSSTRKPPRQDWHLNTTNVWKQLLEQINEASNVWKGLYTFPIQHFLYTNKTWHRWLTGGLHNTSQLQVFGGPQFQ